MGGQIVVRLHSEGRGGRHYVITFHISYRGSILVKVCGRQISLDSPLEAIPWLLCPMRLHCTRV